MHLAQAVFDPLAALAIGFVGEPLAESALLFAEPFAALAALLAIAAGAIAALAIARTEAGCRRGIAGAGHRCRRRTAGDAVALQAAIDVADVAAAAADIVE